MTGKAVNESLPILYIRGKFGDRRNMFLLQAGHKISDFSEFEDSSNYMRPRLVLGQSLIQYKEDDYFYRS